MNKKTDTNYNNKKIRSLLLLIIIAAGLICRLYNIDRKSVWYDEGASLFLSGQSGIFDVIKACVTAVHPPLYHLLIYIFEIFSSNITYLRIINVMFFIPAVIFTYLSVKELKDEKSALMTALLMSFSPFAIHYNIELRMYSLMLLLSSMQIYFILQWVKQNEKTLYAVLFSVVSAAGMMNHYYALFSTAGLIAFSFIIYYIKYKKLDIKKLLLIPAVTFILFLPWLPVFIQHGRENTLSGALSKNTPFSGKIIREYFQEYFLGISPQGPFDLFSRGFNTFSVLQIKLFITFISILLIIGLLALRKSLNENQTSEKARLSFILLSAGVFLPLFLTLILMMLKGRLYSRYMIVYLPLIFFWLNEGVCFAKLKSIRAIFYSIVLLFFFSSAFTIIKSDIRDLTLITQDYLKQYKTPDAVIIHTRVWSFLPYKAYPDNQRNNYLIDNERIDAGERMFLKEGDIIKSTEEFRGRRVILIVQDWNIKNTNDIEAKINREYFSGRKLIAQRNFVMGVKWWHIYVYE